MSSEELSDGPVAETAFSAKVEPDTGLVRLQVFNRLPNAHQSVETSLGFSLPATGQVLQLPEATAYGVGPCRWIFKVAAGTQHSFAQQLDSMLAESLAVVTVISDSRIVITLRGASVREVVARGTSVDLHPDRFCSDMCASTRFASVSALIVCGSRGDELVLIADATHADYLRCWLEAASAGIGH